MHVHILGICGTFMGSLALLAKQLGHRVTGSDEHVYPPMSTQLEAQGITLMPGYDPAHLDPVPDCVVVGNAMSRGNPAVEYVLNRGLRYTSGPQWLAEHVLQGRWVLAVAGTHGKTTTTSMLAWILEHTGFNPGFLIGGVAENFEVSARLGDSDFFVIEADEYDSAFFDKRSKFVHYLSKTLIINNIEFDHADIFPDLAAIQRQFHHLVRTVPAIGQVIAPVADNAVQAVLEQGLWSSHAGLGNADTEAQWQVLPQNPAATELVIQHRQQAVGRIRWPHAGWHNAQNALAAIAAAYHVGIQPAAACEALEAFKGVKRRMELRGEAGGVKVYDDFAHHPTAIELTLEGLRHQVGDARIVAVIEPRSNTMKMGSHKARLIHCADQADQVLWYRPDSLAWLDAVAFDERRHQRIDSIDGIITQLKQSVGAGDYVVVMSNGGFAGIHDKILEALA